MPRLYQKVCEQCRKEYKGRGKRFCSPECGYHWRLGNTRNHISRTCEICGKKFEVTPSVAKKGWGRFCSMACYSKWQSKARRGRRNSNWKGGEAERICETCGEKFKVIKALVRCGGGRFCSKECHYRWKSENLTGKKAPGWKGGRKVGVVCECCGKEFQAWLSHIQRGNSRFCSRKCAGAHHSKMLKAAYKRGDRGIPRSPTSIEKKVTAALEICGIEHETQYSPAGYSRIYDEFIVPNILIEVHGDYWHGNPSCFHEFDERQCQQKVIDAEKAKWARENGYHLVIIWESELKRWGAWTLIHKRILPLVES